MHFTNKTAAVGVVEKVRWAWFKSCQKNKHRETFPNLHLELSELFFETKQ